MSEQTARNETVRRRTILQAGLALAGSTLTLAASGEPVSTDRPSGAEDAGYTTTDVEIESNYEGDDEPVTIAATLYEPDQEGEFPAILGTHGWGGNRSNVNLGNFASNGYVGLAYDSRGFGDTRDDGDDGDAERSDTSQSDDYDGADENGPSIASTIAGPAELADAQSLVQYLADHDAVQTDGEDDPRLGMVGSSYGAGTQYLLAGNDDRVDAIVPEYGWYDLTNALAPNRTLKNGWVLGLFLIGFAFSLDPAIEDRNQAIVERDGLTGDDVDFYQSRSAVSFDPPDAATLVVQEYNDRLFPATEGVDAFEWAQQGPGETALILGNGTAHAQLREEDLPGTDAYDALVDEAIADWFDYHLKDGAEPDLAPVQYYDEHTESFVEADTFPPAGAYPTTVRQSLSESVTLEASGENLHTLSWDIDNETELVGRPTVSLTVDRDGPAEQNHVLVAGLKRAEEDRVIKRQAAPVTIEDDGRVEFELPVLQQTFEAGETLELLLATRAEELPGISFGLETSLFTAPGDDAVLTLSVDDPVELTVPMAIEDVPPPVVGTRRPQNPAGDGRFRDINGDGSVDIFDVQLLFTNLDNPAIQDNAEYYNFSGEEPDEVTIFDVQALFNDL